MNIFSLSSRAAIVGFGLLLGSVAAGGAQAAPAQLSPHISVTGMGEARVTPDRATIFIGVQSRATAAAVAAADNARRQRAVVDTLRALGVTTDELSTTSYNVSPDMQYPQSGGPPKVTGYTVTNTVRVDVRRLEDVGKLIDASLAKGANNISGLQYFSSKADSARRAALSEAIVKAHADAEAMAKAAGGELGALIELSSESAPTPRFEMAMARAVPGSPAPTQIDPGVQTISASVTAQWSFTPR